MPCVPKCCCCKCSGCDEQTPIPQPPPNDQKLPKDVLDLKNWKLTLPSGSPGKPTEVMQPALDKLATADFYADPKGCIVFKAHCGGYTTTGSSYPRSELREMDGDKLAAWDVAQGSHKMSWTAAITNIPVVKPQVVVGQIHDAEDDLIFIRLSKNVLEVVHDTTYYGVLDSNYILGTKYKMSILVSGGKIIVTYNDTKSVTIKPKASKINYFKLGMYTQSNVLKGDKPDAYGQVEIYECKVTHEK
jgi:poly(beta-D-mannuronate) lyase